jgi:DNA/RNA-binding domain of Phe-tRNA-synthetase-like protein
MMTTEDAASWLATAQVDAAVFDLRPDYAALLITADGLTPGPAEPATDALLAAAEAQALAALAGGSAESLEQVAQWREAYRAFGARPQRTRPSVEALLRRLPGGLPRIDRITDVYNAVSVGHLLPVGGEDLTAYSGPACLVRATGGEDFDTTASGLPVVEHPEPGEVIWRDDKGVTCRRWNWRQCTRTRITEATTSAVFILDGLPALGPDGLSAAADELCTALAALSPQARFARRLIDAPPPGGTADEGSAVS